MLTGRRAFVADEVSDTLAMVLMKEPDWPLLPAATPPAVRTLRRRSLEKDRRRRLPDIGVARLDIDEAVAAPPTVVTATTPTPSQSHVRRERAAWAAVAMAAIVAAGIGAVHFMERPPAPAAAIRIPVMPPAGSEFTTSTNFGQALSPDGRQIAFQILRAGQSTLAIRTFDADEAREIPGTGGAGGTLFWSPDSRLIAFIADGKLKKVDVAGRPPQVVCDVSGVPAGGSWSGDTILFATAASGVFRVPAAGGTPVPVTKLDATKKESAHRHPSFLPDGEHFLYAASSAPTGGQQQLVRPVYVGSLGGASRRGRAPKGTLGTASATPTR